jgi:hypothetical protein
MIAQAAFRRTQGEMVLHPVTGEHLGVAIVTMNRQRHGQGAFGILDPVAFRVGDLKVIGDQIELLAGHLKSRVVVNVHRASLKEDEGIVNKEWGPAPGTGIEWSFDFDRWFSNDGGNSTQSHRFALCRFLPQF